MHNFFQKVKVKIGNFKNLVLFGLIILLSFSLLGSVQRMFNIKNAIKKEETRLAKLRKENEDLKKKAEEAGKDIFFEKEARNKLGLGKEGEIIVVLPDDETLKKLAPKREEEEDVLPDPNWKKWMKLFLY